MFTSRVGAASQLPRSLSGISLLCCLFFLSFGRQAGADTYTVSNLNDSGAGSLRQAILAANSHSGADTIVFTPGLTGALPLLTVLPTISDDVEIDGPGADSLSIGLSGAASYTGIFLIDGAGIGPAVTFTGLTITNGLAIGGGGGIKNVHGNVTMRNCMISSNQADTMGGGIFNAGTMTLTGCTIANNTIGVLNGPVLNLKGGGIYNTGTLILTECTLGGNSASVNEPGPEQAIAQGGGIYSTGAVTLSHCTLAENSVRIFYNTSIVSYAYEAGEGNTLYSAGSLTLDNTILLPPKSPGTPLPGATLVNKGGTIVSHGYNLTDSNTVGLLTGVGEKVAATQVLDPLGLRHNGGSTLTYNLVAGSPAIDAGDPAFSSASATDQCGRPRLLGERIDIGAVEYRQPFDFDVDGHTDLLFQSNTTGQLVAWYMNGLNLQGGIGISAVPDAGWKVVAVADFNDDGNPDLVFQNTTTKKIVIWFMAGATRMGGIQLPTPPATYNVVGAADFNGDGKPDLVFEDSASSNIPVWILSQGTIVSSTALKVSRQAQFPIVGVADLNQDGYPDLLLQDVVSGQLVAWYFTGLNYQGGKFIQRIPDAGWKVKALGDYNNDGSLDIVFQNAMSGKVALWFMKDLVFQGGDFTTTQPLVPYQIVGPH